MRTVIGRIEKEGDSERWCYGRKRISECCLTNSKNNDRVFFMQDKLSFLFCKQLQRLNRARDHSDHYSVQYLENNGPATEQSDWLILIISSLAA